MAPTTVRLTPALPPSWWKVGLNNGLGGMFIIKEPLSNIKAY